MISIYFSQPFEDRSVESLRNEQERVVDYFDQMLDIKVEIQKRYTMSTASWLETLANMAKCSIIVFAHNWEESKFCRLEMEICKTLKYGYMVLEDD